MAGADGPAGVIMVCVGDYNMGCEAGAEGNGNLAGRRKVKGLIGSRVSDGECQNSAADNRCDSCKESECVRSHGTGAKSPNDPKLSDARSCSLERMVRRSVHWAKTWNKRDEQLCNRVNLWNRCVGK